MTIPPTIVPRTTIKRGSISEVRALRVASISSSQKSAIFSSMVSIFPVCSPAPTIRTSMGGKIGSRAKALANWSPLSISVETFLMAFST